MNQWVLDFARKHKGKISGNVLEVGSFNVNGGLRELLPITVGIDMREGPGVDRVLSVSDLLATYGPESFDCVCSADALEHIEDWESALVNMWGVLKPGGVLFLTMANMKKGYHGYPSDFWRWPLDDFKRLFWQNMPVDCFEAGPSQGVVVIKAAALDLSIKPRAVECPSRLTAHSKRKSPPG